MFPLFGCMHACRVASHPVLGGSEALMLWLTHPQEDVTRSCPAWAQMLGARKAGERPSAAIHCSLRPQLPAESA